MLNTIIFFLPCLVNFMWFMIFLFRKKNRTQRFLTELLGLSTFHFAGNAIYISPDTSTELWCIWDMLCQPLVLCLIAICILYVRTHVEKYSLSRRQSELIFAPAIIQGTLIWFMYFVIGPQNIVRYLQAIKDIGKNTPLYEFGSFKVLPQEFNTQIYHMFHFFDNTTVSFFCIVLATILSFSCIQVSRKMGYKFGDGFRFWFKGQATTPERAVSYWLMMIVISESPFVILGRKFIYYNPSIGLTISILLCISLFCLCYCEYFSHISEFTLHNLTHLDLSCTGAGSTVVTQPETPKNAESAMSQKPPTPTDYKTAALISELHRLLDTEKVFTDKELTLESLAKQMNTNRNRLSTLVNQAYGEDFRNVIARMRIEEAKNFMRENPAATSETIASHCGFKDTSAFFHRFKDIEGVSPRTWLST